MSKLIELLEKVLMALRPSESNDPVVQLAWRRVVAATLGGMIVLLACSALGGFMWMNGKIPGLSGVALADDLRKLDASVQEHERSLQVTLESIQIRDIKNTIKQALKDKCHAIYAKNQLALDVANSDLYETNSQYRRIQGYDYPQLGADCSVILIQETPGG